MTPNEQVQANQIELAQVFWLPCQCGCHFEVSTCADADDHRKVDCPDCAGSGKLWPLQKPCPGFLDQERGRIHNYANCPCKRGVGWIYNDGRDVLAQAIRAKGWSIRGYSCPHWDSDALVMLALYVELSRVSETDGLRGMAALELVTLRAWRAVECSS